MTDPQKPLLIPSEVTDISEVAEATPPQVESTGEIEEQTENPAETTRRTHGGDTRVLIHNDDETPYDFVIDTLNTIFMLSEEMAEHVAWTAHTRGTAVVVIRPRPEAEKLVKAAHARAKFNRHPLTFSLEAD
ncbi:MAG: ATP-dependent Clp protease adaptor ClpS [Litorilinea sp.]